MAIDTGFSQLLEIAPFACVILTDDYCINYINPVLMDFLCISEDKENDFGTFIDFISKEDQKTFVDFFTSPNLTENAVTWNVFRIVDTNGDKKKLFLRNVNNNLKFQSSSLRLLTGIPLGREIIGNITPDIIKSNITNKISYNKYEILFESSTLGILVLTKDGFVDEINRTFANYLSLSKSKAQNKHYSDLFVDVIESDFDKLRRMINAAKTHQVKNIITTEKKNGEHRIFEILLEKIESQDKGEGLIMLIAEDITEEQDTQTALLQSEKLALTGRLAASLAHEINNPLQTSIGCLGLADEMLQDEDRELRVYINMAIEELKRSARIVKRLRDLNRRIDIVDKEPINIKEILESVIVLTKNRLLDRNILTIQKYQDPPPIVFASKDQIKQVILNLFLNAIDALPEGGNIHIFVSHTNRPQGVNLIFMDNGVGIAREVIEKIFDPFFTTKDEGLGLGLYTSKKIIEGHKGKLSVKSEMGKGTEITIWLPGYDISNQLRE